MIVPMLALEGYFFTEAQMEFEDLLKQLGSPEAMELTHGQAEELIGRRGQEVLRRLFQGWKLLVALKDVLVIST